MSDNQVDTSQASCDSLALGRVTDSRTTFTMADQIAQIDAALALERASKQMHPMGFRPGSLYLVILSPTYKPLGRQAPRPMSRRWHWGLYCHAGEMGGPFYHVRQTSARDRMASAPVHDRYAARPNVSGWRYEALHFENMLESVPVVCAIKVAVLDDDLRAMLGERIAQVDIRPTISNLGSGGNDVVESGVSSCSWTLKVLDDLNQEGWISIKTNSSVEMMYNEAVETGIRAEQLDVAVTSISQCVHL